MPSQFSARVTVRVKGVAEVYDYLQRIGDKLRNPRDGVARMLSEVARYWELNYQSEGAFVSGGWADLTDRTAEERESQGYDGYHPVLIRSYSLQRAAIEVPLMAGMAQSDISGYWTPPYDARASVTGVVRLEPTMARLEVEGRGVWNQWKTRTAPARPFWLIDDDGAATRATYGVWDWLINEVLQ